MVLLFCDIILILYSDGNSLGVWAIVVVIDNIQRTHWYVSDVELQVMSQVVVLKAQVKN